MKRLPDYHVDGYWYTRREHFIDAIQVMINMVNAFAEYEGVTGDVEKLVVDFCKFHEIRPPKWDKPCGNYTWDYGNSRLKGVDNLIEVLTGTEMDKVKMTEEKAQELRDKYIEKAKSMGQDHVHEIEGNPMFGACNKCNKSAKDILLSEPMEPFLVWD